MMFNKSCAMSKQECVDVLTEIGIPVVYEPRVLLPENIGGEVIEVSVFEAVDRLGLWRKTDFIKK